MDKWFESKLIEIGKLNFYIKPVKSKGVKLDANENLVLKKDFIKKISDKADKADIVWRYIAAHADKLEQEGHLQGLNK